MGRGFLAGIFWGGIVGLAILFVSDRVMDRRELSFPKPEAVAVEVPAGTEFDQARPESEPVVPETETRPAPELASGVTPPEDAVETPPAFDTTALEVPTPSVDGPAGLGDIPAVADEIEIEVTGPAPGAASPSDAAPALTLPETPADAPDTSTAAPAAPAGDDVGPVDIAIVAPSGSDGDGPAAPPMPSPTPSDSGLAPAPEPVDTQTADAPDTSAAPMPVPAPDTEDSANAIVRPDGGSSEFFKPVEDLTDRAPSVETDRLPRIGDAPTSEEEALPSIRRLPGQSDTETVLIIPSDDDPLPDNAPALLKNRIPFENPDGRPLLSIILVHQGEAALSMDEMASIPSEVAFAIDTGLPGAKGIAADYRAAGREVVMIPSLPEGATPQDVEVALRVNFDTVPEAVAVMDNSGESFQSDRAAVAQVVDVVVASGHGLITFPRGLNTAHQLAERAGVPTGLIFRDIDDDDQSNEQIRRAMDRAAFRARQDEAIILVGRTQSETIAAVIEWALGNRAASVTLAPVSAALIDG